MGQMKQHPRARCPKELDNKPERTIACHVEWVTGAGVFILFHAGNEQDQHHDVIHQLQLPCWTAQLRSWYDQAGAAPGKDAVDAGAHDCKDHARRKDIKGLFHRPLEKLCTEPVGNRHKEHSAKQAHVAEGGFVKSGFKKGEYLHRQHAENGMKNRQRDRRIPRHVQPIPHENKPCGAAGKPDAEQDPQGNFDGTHLISSIAPRRRIAYAYGSPEQALLQRSHSPGHSLSRPRPPQ